jgi:hypothetical protein
MNDLYTEIIALKFRNSSSRAPPECVKGSELHYVSEVWRVWGSELHYVSEVWRVWGRDEGLVLRYLISLQVCLGKISERRANGRVSNRHLSPVCSGLEEQYTTREISHYTHSKSRPSAAFAVLRSNKGCWAIICKIVQF